MPALVNNKAGVGKTTSAVSLAAGWVGEISGLHGRAKCHGSRDGRS